MKKYILIDCNFICYRTFYSKGDLSHDDIDTGIIFGFFNQLLNFCQILDNKNIIFIWDSKSSIRAKHFPSYKGKRNKRKSEETGEDKEKRLSMYRQMNSLRFEILPALGFKNSFFQEGLEGDDIMASIVFDKRYDMDQFVLVANDHDLYQLLSSECCMYIPGKKLYTIKDYKEEFKLGPADWKRVKAIGGCTSDDVPGISNPNPKKPEQKVRNIGEGTAVKYLRGELRETTQAYKNITSATGKAKEEFNSLLVHLPHPETNSFDIVKDKLDFIAFKDMCKKYGFKSFLSERRDEWVGIFKKRKKGKRK